MEHLVTMKTWMKIKEDEKEGGIIQTFDMEKFFDKESHGGHNKEKSEHRQ